MRRLTTIIGAATLLVMSSASAAAQAASTTVASAAANKGVAEAPREITIHREVFSYSGAGRRDPYLSLMTSGEIRPLLSDIRVTAIAFDPTGRNSVAIIRDDFAKTQYRARVGQQLGRMRVSGISAKQVQFTIEEYGFNRTEVLKVTSDTTTVRNP